MIFEMETTTTFCLYRNQTFLYYLISVLLKLYMNPPRIGMGQGHMGEDGVPGGKLSHQMKWHTFPERQFSP